MCHRLTRWSLDTGRWPHDRRRSTPHFAKSITPMRRVVIESPYAGNIEANVAYARRCMADSLRRGEAPIASHLLYTQPGILDDEIPAERLRGIEAGFAWNELADATVVYTDLGITAGMSKGIEHAKLARRPVEYRMLGVAL